MCKLLITLLFSLLSSVNRYPCYLNYWDNRVTITVTVTVTVTVDNSDNNMNNNHANGETVEQYYGVTV